MIKLGILGTDNSHSVAFSKLLNVKDSRDRRVAGARVTHVFGLEQERNEEVAEAGQIPNLVAKPEDMLGEVDGVIVDFRHGSRHLKYAKPFLEAGVPTFVDKPLAHSTRDARQIIKLAQEHKTPLCSFSTVPYGEDAAEYIATVRKEAGALTGGAYMGPADLTSEYDGLIFYGIHLADLMVEIHGVGVREVSAVESDNNVSASVRYADGQLIQLYFVGNGKTRFRMTTLGTNATHTLVPQSGAGYLFGMQKFLKMMKTGELPRTHEEMFEAVKVVEAITKSVEKGAAVKVRAGV